MPDTDQDGVSDLVEVVVSERTGEVFDPTDASTRPKDEKQVQQVFKQLGVELVETIKEQKSRP